MTGEEILFVVFCNKLNLYHRANVGPLFNNTKICSKVPHYFLERYFVFSHIL